MAVVLDLRGEPTGPAPLTYTLSELGTVDWQAAFASFNGASASGSWVPTLTVRSQNGTIIARSQPSGTQAAGASADVSWFPHLAETASVTPTTSAGFNALAEAFGLLAWTLDPAECTQSVRPFNVFTLSPVILAAGDVVGYLHSFVTAVEMTPPTSAWLVMYDNTFSLVAQTASTLALGNATGWHKVATTASYTATYSGAFYIGAVFDPVANTPTTVSGLFNASPPPKIGSSNLWRAPTEATVSSPPASFTPTGGANPILHACSTT